jgi:hypothetical protein
MIKSILLRAGLGIKGERDFSLQIITIYGVYKCFEFIEI